MSRILSGKHTQSYKVKRKVSLFIILILLQVYLLPCAFSQEIRTPKDISPELMKKIEEAVKSFRKPLEKKEYSGIVSKTEEETRKVFEQEKKGGESCSDRDSTPLYYFFSFSMPEELILEAMRSAVRVNQECGEQVSLVLRGFVRNDLRATVSEFYKYLRKVGNSLPVEIDPELFEQFQIKAVPQVLKVRGQNVGIIKGDMVGLSYALSRFKDGLKDYGIYGNLYPIKEEDPLKVFASRQKEIEEELRGRLPEIKKRMTVLSKYDGTFEHVKEEKTRYMDPSVVLRDNIYDHQGRVIFQKGTVFNPGNYFQLGKYVVIDGNAPKQVEFAIRGEFRKVILISGDLAKLVRDYRKPFYFANDELIERFKIKRVPVVIEGEGKYVRITEKAL